MINSTLTIAAVPLPIKWADRHANYAAVEQYMAQIRRDTDVVVFPELFSTGFIPDPEVTRREAETNNGMAMGLMTRMAQKYRVAVAGSFLARSEDGSRIYNRAFFIEPSGEATFYDKRHLFSLSPEAETLEAGRVRMPIIRFRGWNIALAVCYDLRFPVWCRNKKLAYDVVLLPSNWPQSRSYAYRHLLIGRAIENQAWFVGANCSGTDDYGCYDGMTMIADHEGRMVAESTVESPSEPIYATAIRDELEHYRKRMPAWRAADDFEIK